MEKNKKHKNLDAIEKNMDLFVMDEVDSKDEKIEKYSDEYIDNILKEVLDENNKEEKIENIENNEEEILQQASDNTPNYDDIKQNITKILTNNIDKNTSSYEGIKNVVENSNISVLDLKDKNNKDNADNIKNIASTVVFETKTINLKKEKPGNFKYEFHKNLNLYKINDYNIIKINSEDFSKTLIDELNASYMKNTTDKSSIKDSTKDNIEKIEYSKPEDNTKIRKILLKKLRFNFLKASLSGAIFAFLFFVSLFFRLNIFNNILKANNFIYISINFISLLIVSIICNDIILNGIINAFKLKFNFYSGLAFASFACFIQNIFAFLSPSAFTNSEYIIFNLIIIFALFTTSIGEFLNSRRIIGNFNFISAKKSKYKTSCMYNNERKAQELFKGLGNYQAQIAYQNNSDFLCDFLKLSKSKGIFEKSCDKLALIGTIASITIFAIYFILNKNLIASFSVLALTSSISFPLAAGFIINNLMFNSCQKINKNHGMIVGFPAIKKFSESNAILIDANVLYPKESVYLHKIKGAGPLSVDHVVLITAAILQKAKSPLSPIFSSVIKGKKDLIPHVDNVIYIDGMGLEAWVQGHKVIIGTREFMKENKVNVPNNIIKEENIQNKQITYIAFANELVCTMVTSYKPSASLIQKIQNLEDQGVSFLVHSTDPNINAKNIANNFKIFFRSIKVISHKDYLQFESDTNDKKLAPAFTCFGDSIYSFASIILSCIRLKANITALTISQVFCFIICFCTIPILIFYSGISSLHLLEIFFYTLFWSAAVFAISKVRK